MNEEKLRRLLPIGENEKILAKIDHHWFAYVSVYIGAGFVCLLVLAIIVLTNLTKASLNLSNAAVGIVSGLGIIFMAGVAAFSLIPVWIKKQEILVLTEESLIQIKKPSLFSNKVSQLNLQHLADVSVRQNALGTVLGFANLSIETPGEQDNYEFYVVGDATSKAKAIIEAHENYVAALESGQIQTTLGSRPPVPGVAWRAEPQMPPAQNQPQPAAVNAPENPAATTNASSDSNTDSSATTNT